MPSELPPTRERFVWPPRTPVNAVVDHPARAEPRVITVHAPTPRRAIREIERVWLGLTVPPLAERMAEEGVAFDGPGDYCHRCGTTLEGREGARRCDQCRELNFPWQRLVRLGEFKGLLREMVHEVKFTRWRRLGMDLGRQLGRPVADALRGDGVNPSDAVVVPMPSTFRRRMARGIDHARVIARGVALELGCPLVAALERRHRPSQTSLPKTQRARNLAGSMRLRRGVDLGGAIVILVDDVATTRASLLAACRGLRRAAGGRPGPAPVPGRVWAAVVAVTPHG
jgi:predicted amidophosphoribosyltransferase